MASSSILQIVRSVAPRLGLLAPSTATGSSDLQIQQLVALANEEGKELAARTPWQVLTRECTFTTVAAEDQGALQGDRFTPPSAPDILAATAGLSYILNDTIFNRSAQYQIAGPLAERTWQALKGTAATGGFYSEYRLRGGNLLVFPAPPAGQTCAFEYVTENWVSNAGKDEFRTEFTRDDDFPLLDSRLVELGLKWRWKRAKGLDYSEEFQIYENAVLDSMVREKTARKASLDGRGREGIEPVVLVSRGNWMQ